MASNLQFIPKPTLLIWHSPCFSVSMENHRREMPPTFEDGQDIRDRSFEFACRVVRFCQKLYDAGSVGRIMVPQLVNCSTSCATMLEEARGAESDRDFISKCCISLKECREAWTRLRVCVACEIGERVEARALVQEGNQLISIVTAIIRNKKRNMKKQAKTAGRRKSLGQGSTFQIPNS